MTDTAVHFQIPKRVRHVATKTLHTVIGLGPDSAHAHEPEVITWGDPSPASNLGGDIWCGPLARFRAEFEAV